MANTFGAIGQFEGVVATGGLPSLAEHALSTFYSASVNQPRKNVVLPVTGDIRQQEIERLRAEQQSEFDRIEAMMPCLDDLLSISADPPRDWFEERWS